MQKILISACLIGQKVRYHGKDALCDDDILKQWNKEGRLVSLCPEVSAGLPIPRPSSEIVGFGGGYSIISNKARVITHNGIDRTRAFLEGANKALAIATKHNIKIAILKANSPSCGSSYIYDGSFTGNLIKGLGVTAALLTKNKIKVFDETRLDEAVIALQNIEGYGGSL